MSWWLWIAFCASCAGIFLYPSRFNLLIAQQSATRGRTSGILCAAGAGIGLGVCMTIASTILVLWTNYIGPINDFLGWLGMAWLILLGLWTMGTVPYRAAMPDNDNLPTQGLLSSFSRSFALHMISPRFITFFVALLAQFMGAPRSLAILDMINMQIATLIIAFACLSVFAFFPYILTGWLRQFGVKIAKRKPQNKTLISGKSVKARYRKIAA